MLNKSTIKRKLIKEINVIYSDKDALGRCFNSALDFEKECRELLGGKALEEYEAVKKSFIKNENLVHDVLENKEKLETFKKLIKYIYGGKDLTKSKAKKYEELITINLDLSEVIGFTNGAVEKEAFKRVLGEEITAILNSNDKLQYINALADNYGVEAPKLNIKPLGVYFDELKEVKAQCETLKVLLKTYADDDEVKDEDVENLNELALKCNKLEEKTAKLDVIEVVMEYLSTVNINLCFYFKIKLDALIEAEEAKGSQENQENQENKEAKEILEACAVGTAAEDKNIVRLTNYPLKTYFAINELTKGITQYDELKDVPTILNTADNVILISDYREVNEKLEHIDVQLLNAIVFGFYLNGVTEFTASQLLKAYSKENGHESVKETNLKEIIESLDRLRRTFVSYKIEAKNNNKMVLGIERNNQLIYLDATEINKDNKKDILYRIVGDPFYLEFHKANGGKAIGYDKTLFLDNKDGLDNSLKNITLRQYLWERVTYLEVISCINVPYSEIYKICKCSSKAQGKTQTAIKKAQHDARENTKQILTDIKKKAKVQSNPLLFEFNEDISGRRKRGVTLQLKKPYYKY